MHSQSSEKSGTVESQTKSSKSSNYQTMTKRKQHAPSIPQLKNSVTIDLPVVNAIQQMKAPPTISINSNSPTKLVTLSKSQQVTNVRPMPSVPRTTLTRVSPTNGRADIDDQLILNYPVQYQSPAHAQRYIPTSSTISVSMSSPHIGTHQNYHSNQYHSYQPQVQVQQSLSHPCHNDMGNRQNYSNRQNNPNKKGYHSNFSKSKRNGNMSADKNYNSSVNNNKNNKSNNNNNNNNNNEYDYTIANKSARHLGQQFTKNRSYNCDTSKNMSPQRDPYSSSSSSSSSSSMPLSKKSIHHLHSPVIPQLISPISFQGDSRTTANGYEHDLYLINTPYTYTTYAEDCQNQIFSYDSFEWCRNDRFGRNLSHPPPQFQYTDRNTGDLDGKR